MELTPDAGSRLWRARRVLLLAIAPVVMDWRDRTHLLLLVLSVLGYTVVLLGLVALGAHVSRAAGRVLAALEAIAGR